MADPTELGTQLEVGIGSDTLTGYVVQGVTRKPTGTVREILGEDGAATTILISNKGKSLALELVVKQGTDATLLTMGDSVTVDSVIYCVVDVDLGKTVAEEQTVTLDLIKEDSITYV